MTHLARAQPEQPAMVFDPPLAEAPEAPPTDTDTKVRMVRYPDTFDDLIKDAAKRENLSVNAWIVRVVVECAKRSERDGWESSSPNSAPRTPEGRAQLGGRARITEAIAREGKLTLHTGTYPTPENTVTWTRLATDEPYPVEEFDPPDDDIPTLR